MISLCLLFQVSLGTMQLFISLTTQMQLNYSQLGDNTDNLPIIVIHGLFGSKENLNIIAKPLSENHQVINVDLRNHGQSFHDATMNYQVMADDVFNLLNTLNITQCILVGHSMGGKVAMQMALSQGERIAKLVVLDIAPTHYTPRHQNVFNGLKNVNLATINNRSEADAQLAEFIEEPGVRHFLLKSLAKTEFGFSWRFNVEQIITSYDAILAKPAGFAYTKPTLFVKGANSDYILESHRPEIAALFPNAKAKIIAGAGHWLHAEKPNQVNLAISQFVAG